MEPHVQDRESQQIIKCSLVYPALYNGPVNYFARLIREEQILLEQFESYTKQTFRNRCLIMGPNGLLALSIPVKRRRGTKTPMRDIRIDYDTPWNKIHWKSMVASYAASPFFEYYKDDFAVYYEKKTDFLIDLNQQLLECTIRLMERSIQIMRTGSFKKIGQPSDPRYFIHPKMNQTEMDPAFNPVVYHQVFADRLGFQVNLSMVDLLFNEGPAAHSILLKCLKTSPQS